LQLLLSRAAAAILGEGSNRNEKVGQNKTLPYPPFPCHVSQYLLFRHIASSGCPVHSAFSVPTLLVGRQEEHPACKKIE